MSSLWCLFRLFPSYVPLCSGIPGMIVLVFLVLRRTVFYPTILVTRFAI